MKETIKEKGEELLGIILIFIFVVIMGIMFEGLTNYERLF